MQHLKKALSFFFHFKRRSIKAHSSLLDSLILIFYLDIRSSSRLEAVVALPAHPHLLVDLQFRNLSLKVSFNDFVLFLI